MTLDQQTFLDTHAIFTLFFVPIIALTVASVTFRITGKIGLNDVQTITARNAGLAAAFGFLIMSMISLHYFRWEVGGPFAGRRYSMISIMNVCNASAALVGGAVTAWTWLQSLNFDRREQSIIKDGSSHFQEVA